MKKVNLSDITWAEQRSPKGQFHLFRKQISEALGNPRDAAPSIGGHPFEVELARLPPGAVNFPFHSHAAQWEFYLVINGQGELRSGDSLTNVTAGDAFVCPPDEPHQLKNTGSEDLLYYVIANNPMADVVYYPDSKKWVVKPARKCLAGTEVDYYTNEE